MDREWRCASEIFADKVAYAPGDIIQISGSVENQEPDLITVTHKIILIPIKGAFLLPEIIETFPWST